MRKDLLAIGLGMVLSSVTVFSSLAADGTVTLRNHVPNVVAQGKAKAKGHLAGDTTLNLSLGLPLRNREALTNLLAQIYDPKSPNYGHYLTTQQFTDAFGPTEEDYRGVIEFARKNGLKVTQTYGNRMLLSVTGKAADVEKALAISLGQYQHPTEAREFFAADRNPSVPAGLKIQDIGGLENLRKPIPHVRVRPTPPTASGPAQKSGPKINAAAANPNAGSGPAGQFIGDDFRRAYVPGTTLTGAGQSLALVEFDGYFASDIVAYESLTGRPNVPLQNILLAGFSGLPVTFNGQLEVSLDIEMAVAMAPGLAKIFVYEQNPFSFDPNIILNQIAVDNAARQISSSWGWTGIGPSLTTDQIFQQMALQGQTYFNASGDGDAFLPGEVDDLIFGIQPSSNPFITQVGGTTLTMNGIGASYGSETVWNWGNRFGIDGAGSSGGISSFYSIPTWQTNINMALRQGSQTARNIPDVAMIADDVLVISGGIQLLGVGGTSVAAPLWGAFTALANQQGVLNARPSIGFINPALYSIANSPSSYASCFNDTLTGNNTWSQSPTLFNARPGYDLCTGLGTPKGTPLIDALIAFNAPAIHISPPPPPYGSTLANVTGGNPNGAWFMFIQDDAPISSGMVGNGWILSLTTADIIGTSGDLELLMSTTNSTVFVGQPATFVLTVTNYGPSISTNVFVSDDLPLSATIVSTNATQGTVSRSGSTLIWNVGTLTVGSGAALYVKVQPHGLGTLQNSANVGAGTPDPNPDEDFALATVNVVPLSATLVPSFNSTNGTFQISVPGPTNPSLTVVIQANTNLVSTNWVNVYTGTPPINFVDPAPSNTVSRFYRALLLP
jgi:uncharacterized repeat protein (TIGR01451 family)